jgi:FdrA protein
MVVKTIIRRGEYIDSVKLMIVSKKISQMDGILTAAVQMGTQVNKEALKRTGLLDKEAESASKDDLIISIKGTKEAVDEAFGQIDTLINYRASGNDSEYRPKTIDSAFKVMPDANFAIVSVPGTYAKREAMKAMEKGLHVLLFSDNVTLEEELELKNFAVKNGLLLMGPDCGTAMINNIALGFTNKVRKGNIGMVGAAGTGMQEVMSLIHKLGFGITQAIGTGGRDLSAKIGGATMLQGLKALNEDKETEVIVLISKPPAAEIADKILEYIIGNCKKPTVVNFIGGESKDVASSTVYFATTLEEAALKAVELAGNKKIKSSYSDEELEKIAQKEAKQLKIGQKYIRGLYSGGTLCYEGLLVLKDYVGDVNSNTPLNKKMKLIDPYKPLGHTCLDLGDDEFTVGRPHPMIDTTLREQLFDSETSDPQVAVILLDIVIGYGTHDDPAQVFADLTKKHRAKEEKEGRHLIVISSVIGIEEDPQNALVQEQKLRDVGIIVMPCNAAAARLAGKIISYCK